VRPLPFVWPYWIVFWIVFVWAFSPEYRIVQNARQSATRPDSPDAGSYRVIVFGIAWPLLTAVPVFLVDLAVAAGLGVNGRASRD
jgi:hypothetical protein